MTRQGVCGGIGGAAGALERWNRLSATPLFTKKMPWHVWHRFGSTFLSSACIHPASRA